MNPILRLVIALLIAIIGGLLIKHLFPEFSAMVSRNDNSPVYDLWTRILNLISGPVIFSMVVTTVIGLRRLSGKGASSKRIVGRYFLFSAVIAIFTIFVTTVAAHMSVTHQAFNNATVSEVLEFFFQVVPSEVVSPFMEANTPQLIFLAALLGVLLYILREQVPNLIRIVNQINTVCLKVTEWISYLVPIFTCMLLAREIIEGHLGMFINLWQPLVLSVVLTAFVLLCSVLRLSLTKHVPIKVLLSKMKKPFLTALQKGSLSASYGEAEYSCISQMGIDREFTEVSLSNGIVLYMPASILGTVVFVIWAAAFYSIEVTWLWFGIAALFAAILMEAAPPVPGVSLLVYIVIFKMLQIPEDTLIPAMVFDIIIGLLASASNQMLLQAEMIHQADRVGLINRRVLATPLKKSE